MLTLSTKCYISTQGEEGIKSFKYKGGSDSIFYSYFWSPLCDYLVKNYFPSYLAPNSITLIGFLIHLVAHIIVLYYSPDLKQTLPQWLCFLLSFSLLTYQILDNCDGKQARATGSSSPLGMLFDHGCDALTTWIVTLNTAAVFKYKKLHYYIIQFIQLDQFHSFQECGVNIIAGHLDQ
ncbi:hypothetical protein IMG5_191250 [Ichthyophthirius multifiliis]|uniref:Ethanolaminephosphotransferase n=1 Tax=Ichthyophthirius multifiliis TaxID=5932 RepID=G0R4D0_ICHMU|nr:hypothetical protein IMG5_191250 [Ichthyophthirius multifiliis]EGR27680.1 hypothetical protein IMG5_191250 [Ichthyophthirius multifiliis]|eukprot:XP_004025132.1 hypothetical protein IMG5_191250 [Ichthyophthirius multifiliis]